MDIRVEVDEVQLRARWEELRAMRAAGQDPRPAFKRVIEDFLDMEKRVFTSQGASIGAPWDPIGPRSGRTRSTSRSKKVYRNPHPLRLTGVLYRSLTAPTAKWGIRKVTLDQMTVGTRDPVAHLHADGTPKHLPQRQLISIDKTDEDRWVGYIEDHLFASLGGGRRAML